MISVIDYGLGNFGSVQNMLKIAGFNCRLTNNKDDIRAAEKIILPGIGAFDSAMQRLKDNNLTDIIIEKVIGGTPILGICLGAQLLMRSSEEGILPGLGLLPADCKKFDTVTIAPLKIPHMGWNEIDIVKKHPILNYDGINVKPRFYFAHSYYFKAADEDLTLATSTYGHSFDCVLAFENIVAAQFHPEKSHNFGRRFLDNFAQWRYEKN